MVLASAVLDADFIQKIATIQKDCPDTIFQQMMCGLKCTPVVHPYVMNNELFSCAFAKRMVEASLLRIVEYDEFIGTDDRKRMYEAMFCDAYQLLTFERLGCGCMPPTDIFARCAGNDYGEIHSVLMAAELGIPVFYSNDHSAKTLCERFSNGGVKSFTMEEVCEQLAAITPPPVSSRQRKYLKHR